MKHTKKLLSAVMAFAMVSAIAPMSAFADTQVKQDSSNHSGDMIATYDVKAKYTVTIPAGVTLDSENSVSANIEASNVILESGQKIEVTLTGASNTAEGSSFSAKTEKGDSTATYTIGKGTATTGVSVGDTVAEFTENGTQSITFSKAEGATYAGTHTETLTFNIAVEDAVTTPTVGTVFPIGTADLGNYYYWSHEMNADKHKMKFRNFGNATISVEDNYSHSSLGNYRVISITSPTAQKIDWEMTQEAPSGPWATWSNGRSDNYFKVDNYDTTPTGIRIASGSGTEDDPFSFEIVFD